MSTIILELDEAAADAVLAALDAVRYIHEPTRVEPGTLEECLENADDLLITRVADDIYGKIYGESQ